jgi:hypothetical protein
MKNQIIPLIDKHKNELFHAKLAEKIINQTYKFEDNMEIDKINKPYFYENKQILWKRNNDFSLTTWVRNTEIIHIFCHFKGPWENAHILKFRNKMKIHFETVNLNIIDLLACKAITV